MTLDARDLAVLLVTWLIHGTAIGVGVLLLLRCFGNPSTRAALARFALVAPLVTTAVAQLTPISMNRITWPEPAHVLAVPSVQLAPRPGHRLKVSRHPDGLQMTVVNEADEEVRAPIAMKLPQDRRALAIIAIWLFGFAVMSVRLTFAVCRHRRLLKQRLPADNTETAVVLRELMAAAGEVKGIRLTTVEALDGPIALARREICVPAIVQGLDANTVRAILAHELAHVRRRDPEWSIASLILTTVGWCQPILWLLSRAARRNAELTCDEFAARHAGGPDVVAATLAHVAEWAMPTPLAAGIRGAKHLLVHRVERLLNGQPLPPSRRLLACSAAAVFVALALVALPVVSAPSTGRVTFATRSGPVVEINVPR
jgi:beta-lactamase regulating signal transducer with metallopeptidase domain